MTRIRTARMAVVAVGVAALGGAVTLGSGAPQAPEIVVYKSPTCRCCANWVDHIRAAGFTVTVHDTADVGAVKTSYGVPQPLWACHTATVGGYVIEGHVPADVLQQLLRERPGVVGIVVPGMPMGAPGMEGGSPDRYHVLLFDRAGRTRVYATR